MDPFVSLNQWWLIGAFVFGTISAKFIKFIHTELIEQENNKLKEENNQLRIEIQKLACNIGERARTMAVQVLLGIAQGLQDEPIKKEENKSPNSVD